MNYALENYNIASDPRSKGPAPDKILVYDPDVDGDTFIEIPSKWGVCPVCGGEGSHVNPSIDAGGISAEDFYEDPEFAEDYMGGTYDVVCNRCNGKRVVRVADYNAMSDYDKELLEEQRKADREFEAERLGEIRAGC